MPAAAPQSSLQELQFLIPKAPAAADMFSSLASTASTQQSTFDKQQTQVNVAAEQAHERMSQVTKETQQGLSFLLDHAAKAQDFKLKNILFPLELQKKQAELTTAAAHADKEAFDMKMAREAEVRAAEARGAYSEYLPKFMNQPDTTVESLTPGSAPGVILAKRDAARFNDGMVEESAQVNKSNMFKLALHYGEMAPEDIPKWKANPEFQNEVIKRTRRTHQITQLNERADKLSMGIEAEVVDTADGKPVTWADVQKDPTKYTNPITGELNRKVVGALSDAMANIAFKRKEREERLETEHKLEVEREKGLQRVSNTQERGWWSLQGKAIDNKSDEFQTQLRVGAQESIARYHDLTRMYSTAVTTEAKLLIANEANELKRHLGDAKTAFDYFKVRSTSDDARFLKEMDIKAKEGQYDEVNRQRMYSRILSTLKTKFGLKEGAEVRALKIMQGFEASLRPDLFGGPAGSAPAPGAALVPGAAPGAAAVPPTEPAMGWLFRKQPTK